MRAKHIGAVDLNLLPLLDLLLEAPNVTKAAESVHLSQSATSRALSRLREQLGDELFVTQGRKLVRTPYAARLRGSLHQVLGDLSRLLLANEAFDPSTTRRRFTIGTVDHSALLLVPALRERFAVLAPQAELAVRACSPNFESQLETDGVDVVLAPQGQAPTWVARSALLESGWSVASRPTRKAPRRLTLGDYAVAGHVVVSPGGGGPSHVDTALAAAGLERRVLIRVPDFLSAAFLVVSSDLLLTLPTKLADHLGPTFRLALRECPASLAPARLFLNWHSGRNRDERVIWLRGLIEGVVARGGRPEKR